MTLAASGALGIGTGTANRDIAVEFGLASNAVFPTAFYGKGGAPASGALSFADFYGRSNAATATASPDPVSGSASTASFAIGSAFCGVTGGVGPFTYAWVKLGGDAKINITGSTTSATVNFQATAMSPGSGVLTATFRCDVTDTGNGGAVSAGRESSAA